MQDTSSPPAKIGAPASPKPGTWVQTERKAHESWAKLIQRKPTAAMLMHVLVAHMGHQNAVVISQSAMAKLIGKSVRTVRDAVKILEAEKWVQVVRMNGPGTVCAYVVNDRVAWGQKRNLQAHLSVFSAHVVADQADQSEETLEQTELRRIPSLYAGEHQLPAGPGEEPPSQPALAGLEPDLPHINKN